MSLRLKNVRLPLARFSLEAELEFHGRVTALFGPSGSGKTSLLDLIAGLRRAESAFLQFNDEVLVDTSRGVFVPAHRRRIGYVPQDLALFPHLSVRNNLRYGQRSKGESRLSAAPVIEMLELGPLLDRGVGQLSGGERQRVALARALLSAPRLLLLDEPLASLDLPLKTRILPYLLRVRDEFRLPMLYVTHDRFEALSLADELVVMAAGKILQTGPVPEVFSRPANLAAAGILTVETVQPGRVVRVEQGLASVAVGGATVTGIDTGLPTGTEEVYVCIRAEEVILVQGAQPASSARNHLPAVVTGIQRTGPLMRVELDCGFPLAALLTGQACEELVLRPGSPVVALVKAPHVHLLPR